MTSLVVSVHGVEPAPQGSKRHVGGGRMVEMSKQLPVWRAAVVDAARNAIAARDETWSPLDGELELVAIFYLRPPATMPRGRTGPTVPPDLDKCVRSSADALGTAGVYVDDARITRIVTEKRYASGERAPGVWLRIRHRHEAAADA